MSSRVKWGSGLARKEREWNEKQPPKPKAPAPETMLSGSMWITLTNLAPEVYALKDKVTVGDKLMILPKNTALTTDKGLIPAGSMLTYLCTRKERRTVTWNDKDGMEKGAINYVTEHFFLHGANIWHVTDGVLAQSLKLIE